jgi:hypothetical protein
VIRTAAALVVELGAGIDIADLPPLPPEDAAASSATVIQVSRVPAEGREVYVKVGYSY